MRKWRLFMRWITFSLSITMTLVPACLDASSAAQPSGTPRINQQIRAQQAPKKESKIHPEVRRKAQEDGVGRVLISLNMPFERVDSKLGLAEQQKQRAQIASAQNALLQQLAGTKHKVVRKFEDIPVLGLEIESKAIPILESSDLVTDVTLSRVRRFSVAQAVPQVGGDQAWLYGFDGSGQVVAILDTGTSRDDSFFQNPTTGSNQSGSGILLLSEQRLR
jgi:hypothetical protein